MTVAAAGPRTAPAPGRAAFRLHDAGLEALAVDACADVVLDAVDAPLARRGTLVGARSHRPLHIAGRGT
ncbi:hypothetical protein [Streptomyces sp. NBC_00328]|uniref:hypothetical protein n=1 Tax=Streptomyces sp. NBC_00328 TaxID=2903646 RepID=UPI003FA69174